MLTTDITVYLGVQSREKFCFEDELREYVHADFMEVHVAFSRDSRGVAYDPHNRDLVERQMPPRYIDTLIVEQGATISDLVMSKKQGGLGGYLYVCGSVAVFDSVMSGIRKAIYTHCTATMENVDLIVNKAFAERRFMLDVFMTPKPLPCNLPTIPLSQLAVHTGHRPGSRMWIGVHGSVYDVTDFCPMHPGGTQIVKSNAGVDCSKSFDNLAHTNNPEVASLLTKYFVGHLTPKPDFQSGSEDMSMLYDLWAGYLRTTVETLVAHQIEMHELQGASLDASSSHDRAGIVNIWLRENLPNTIAIRTFYEYQSRLLQGGFSALFGGKLQELVLKLSFALANASGPGANIQFPDILGAVARAKTSADAVACTNEVALVGQFVCGAEGILRFQERGVFSYAARSVELDIELLEDLRQEVCTGMDAFDSIANSQRQRQQEGGEDGEADVDDESRLTALSAFLLQILERIARRLGIFYAQLAQCSVYRPELERNPARTRWALVRRCIWDGSLFVLAHAAETEALAAGRPLPSHYTSRANLNQKIDFDDVMTQVRGTLAGSPEAQQQQQQQRQLAPGLRLQQQQQEEPVTLNAVRQTRGQSTGDASAVATRENAGALRAMSSFVEKNSKAIRRLSKMPTAPMSFEEIRRSAAAMGVHTPPGSAESVDMMALAGSGGGGRLPTPPSSRVSSRSPSRTRHSSTGMSHSAEMLLSKINGARVRHPSMSMNSRFGNASNHAAHGRHPSQHHHQQQQQQQPLYPVIGGVPTPPASVAGGSVKGMHSALGPMLSRLNSRRSLGGAQPPTAGTSTSQNHPMSMPMRTRSVSSTRSGGGRSMSRGREPGHASMPSTNSMRSFRLRGVSEVGERVQPTF